MLHFRERKEDSFGRVPVERSHGEVIILPLSDSELLFEVLKRIELVASIEFLIILPMTAFHFPVVPGCERPDQLMLNAKLRQCCFKQG